MWTYRDITEMYLQGSAQLVTTQCVAAGGALDLSRLRTHTMRHDEAR